MYVCMLTFVRLARRASSELQNLNDLLQAVKADQGRTRLEFGGGHHLAAAYKQVMNARPELFERLKASHTCKFYLNPTKTSWIHMCNLHNSRSKGSQRSSDSQEEKLLYWRSVYVQHGCPASGSRSEPDLQFISSFNSYYSDAGQTKLPSDTNKNLLNMVRWKQELWDVLHPILMDERMLNGRHDAEIKRAEFENRKPVLAKRVEKFNQKKLLQLGGLRNDSTKAHFLLRLKTEQNLTVSSMIEQALVANDAEKLMAMLFCFVRYQKTETYLSLQKLSEVELFETATSCNECLSNPKAMSATLKACRAWRWIEKIIPEKIPESVTLLLRTLVWIKVESNSSGQGLKMCDAFKNCPTANLSAICVHSLENSFIDVLNLVRIEKKKIGLLHFDTLQVSKQVVKSTLESLKPGLADDGFVCCTATLRDSGEISSILEACQYKTEFFCVNKLSSTAFKQPAPSQRIISDTFVIVIGQLNQTPILKASKPFPRSQLLLAPDVLRVSEVLNQKKCGQDVKEPHLGCLEYFYLQELLQVPDDCLSVDFSGDALSAFGVAAVLSGIKSKIMSAPALYESYVTIFRSLPQDFIAEEASIFELAKRKYFLVLRRETYDAMDENEELPEDDSYREDDESNEGSARKKGKRKELKVKKRKVLKKVPRKTDFNSEIVQSDLVKAKEANEICPEDDVPPTVIIPVEGEEPPAKKNKSNDEDDLLASQHSLFDYELFEN